MTSDPNTVRLSRTIWLGVGLLIVTLALAFVLARFNPQRHAQIPILGHVANFTLTNQFGKSVTLDDLRGHVWIADVIFTRCPGPCPRMTRQMADIQSALPPRSSAKLISLTTDPEFDTPEILAKYPERLGLKTTERWWFLTGTKLQLANLGIDSLKLAAVEKKPEERTSEDDLFIHSTMFVVVDKHARLRALFETGGEGVKWTNTLPQIIATVKKLDRER